jgi:serine/threonine-protein kinase
MLPTSVSADGSRVIVHQDAADGVQDLRMLMRNPSPPGGWREQTLVATRFWDRGGILSPDNRWLAYESDSSGKYEIYVRPFPNVDAGQWQISQGGGVQALWSKDGTELFYVSFDDGALMKVSVSPRNGVWNAGTPAKLFAGSYYDGGRVSQSRHYDVTADGKRFLMIKGPPVDASAERRNFTVVQNWFEELKRLVPTK